MHSIRDIGTYELSWIKPFVLKRIYELRAGEVTLAVLSTEGAFGGVFRVETAEGKWTLKNEGSLFARRGVVREAATGEEVATLKGIGGSKQLLQFTDGRSFIWRRTSFWRGFMAWETLEGSPLVQLSKAGKQVEIEAEFLRLPELALLIAIGYGMVLRQQQAESAAAAASIG